MPKDAFRKLYDESYKNLFGYIFGRCGSKTDTDDILQTVYTNFFKRYRSEGFPNSTDSLKILFTYAKHELYKYYGAESLKKDNLSFDEEIADEALHSLSSFTVPDTAADDELLLSQIWEIIESRGEDVKRLFILHYKYGYTLKECAELTEYTEAYVTNKIYRTIKDIKTKVQEVKQSEA